MPIQYIAVQDWGYDAVYLLVDEENLPAQAHEAELGDHQATKLTLTPALSLPLPTSRSKMASRGAPSSAADRGILRSRGWSRLVSSIAHSPGGIPAAGSGGSRGGQGSSLEVPRTPKDFDQLLRDAGLNID